MHIRSFAGAENGFALDFSVIVRHDIGIYSRKFRAFGKPCVVFSYEKCILCFDSLSYICNIGIVIISAYIQIVYISVAAWRGERIYVCTVDLGSHEASVY